MHYFKPSRKIEKHGLVRLFFIALISCALMHVFFYFLVSAVENNIGIDTEFGFYFSDFIYFIVICIIVGLLLGAACKIIVISINRCRIRWPWAAFIAVLAAAICSLLIVCLLADQTHGGASLGPTAFSKGEVMSLVMLSGSVCLPSFFAYYYAGMPYNEKMGRWFKRDILPPIGQRYKSSSRLSSIIRSGDFSDFIDDKSNFTIEKKWIMGFVKDTLILPVIYYDNDSDWCFISAWIFFDTNPFRPLTFAGYRAIEINQAELLRKKLFQ